MIVGVRMKEASMTVIVVVSIMTVTMAVPMSMVVLVSWRFRRWRRG